MGVFEKAIISGADILPYIPQRPPMVMVDSYFGKNGDLGFTGFTTSKETIFCKDGYFQEVGLIEHIAQSAAVIVGVDFAGKQEEIPVGFIGAVSKFSVLRLPATGETLHTTTRFVQDFMDVSLIYSEVKIDEVTIASGELKIFLQKNS